MYESRRPSMKPINSGVTGPMRRVLSVAAVVLLAACGGDGGTEVGPDTPGSVRGTVTDHTGADVPPGPYTLAVTPPAGFTIGAAGTVSVTVAGGAQANASAIVLKRDGVGEWAQRAGLLVANSEYALAESNGKIYVMGGYPASRVTSRTVQVYDIASDRWQLGPELPQPNNHGMAAAVNAKIYLLGGQ